MGYLRDSIPIRTMPRLYSTYDTNIKAGNWVVLPHFDTNYHVEVISKLESIGKSIKVTGIMIEVTDEQVIGNGEGG